MNIRKFTYQFFNIRLEARVQATGQPRQWQIRLVENQGLWASRLIYLVLASI